MLRPIGERSADRPVANRDGTPRCCSTWSRRCSARSARSRQRSARGRPLTTGWRAGHDIANAAAFLWLRVDESDRAAFMARIAAVLSRAAALIAGGCARDDRQGDAAPAVGAARRAAGYRLYRRKQGIGIVGDGALAGRMYVVDARQMVTTHARPWCP